MYIYIIIHLKAINYNKSIGNDAGADEARKILKSLGYDPADYGL